MQWMTIQQKEVIKISCFFLSNFVFWKILKTDDGFCHLLHVLKITFRIKYLEMDNNTTKELLKSAALPKYIHH